MGTVFPGTSLVIRVEHESICDLTFVKFEYHRSAFDCRLDLNYMIRRLKAKEGIYGSDYVFSSYVWDHRRPDSDYKLIGVKELMGIKGRCCEELKVYPFDLLVDGHTRSCKTRMTTLEKGYNERFAAVSKADFENGII